MRVDNSIGIRNLCAVALHLRQTMPKNSATNFAIRTVLREAINKSNPGYKGNINRRNCAYLSLAAEALLAANPGARLVADHAIPVSLSLREFEGLEQPSLDAVVALVARYAVMVLITLDEDARLRAAGLVKAMPSDWDGQELLARYRQVGIPIKPGQALQLK